MADPRAQAILSRAETERMRGQGASVLADQPL
jgi:protease-4